MSEQTNTVTVTVTDAGDVQVAILDETGFTLITALLSTSSAQKVSKALTDAATAAEEQDRLNRRRDRLAVQEARLLAQLADLQRKAAELAAR